MSSLRFYTCYQLSGVIADRIGFRASIIQVFGLLTIGYTGLSILPTLLESSGLVTYDMTTTFTGLLESPYQWDVIPVLVFIVIGGAFIKAVIPGTVARETTTENRAHDYFIFLYDSKYRRILREDCG